MINIKELKNIKNIYAIDIGREYSYIVDVRQFMSSKNCEIKKIKTSELIDFLKSHKGKIAIFYEQSGIYSLKLDILNSNSIIKYTINGKEFRGLRLASNKGKNDLNDVKIIAKAVSDLLLYNENEYLTKFHKPLPYECKRLRRLLKFYEQLIRQTQKIKNKINNYYWLLLGKNKKIDYISKSTKEKILKLLEIEDEINGIYGDETKFLLEIYDYYFNKANEIKLEIEEIIKNHPDYQKLKKVFEGKLLIAHLIATYWDINRFNSIKQFKALFKFHFVKVLKSGKTQKIEKTIKVKNIKRYFYLLLLHTKNPQIRKLWNYYKKIRKLSRAKAFTKFSYVLVSMLYKYLKEGEFKLPEGIEKAF